MCINQNIGLTFWEVVFEGIWTIFYCMNRKYTSCLCVGRNSGMDGPGIESRWGRDFSQPSRPALGPTQLPIQWILGLFPGGKAAGAWR